MAGIMYIIVAIVAIALLVTLKPSWIGHWKKITDGLTVQYWTMLACILLSSFATKTLVDILRWFFLVTMPSFPILQSLMSLVWILNGVFLFELAHRFSPRITAHKAAKPKRASTKQGPALAQTSSPQRPHQPSQPSQPRSPPRGNPPFLAPALSSPSKEFQIKQFTLRAPFDAVAAAVLDDSYFSIGLPPVLTVSSVEQISHRDIADWDCTEAERAVILKPTKDPPPGMKYLGLTQIHYKEHSLFDRRKRELRSSLTNVSARKMMQIEIYTLFEVHSKSNPGYTKCTVSGGMSTPWMLPFRGKIQETAATEFPKFVEVLRHALTEKLIPAPVSEAVETDDSDTPSLDLNM